MKCNFIGCDTPISIQFVALLRSKKPYCKTHRYSLVGEKISKSKLDKNKPVITCCASGMRSGAAKNFLKSNGFKEVYNGGSWISLRNKI